MIRIIRTKNLGMHSPAGEIFNFDNNNDTENISDACAFMWGKSSSNYMLFFNGLRVDINSNLGVFENTLKELLIFFG